LALSVPGVDVNLPEATRGETPLHLAVDDSNEAFVALLLQRPAIQLDKASFNGSSALHFAAKREQSAIASMLLQAGASPNPRRLFRWRTPLHLACSVSSKGTVSPQLLQALLAGGADANARDREMMTPAHVLASSGGGAASKTEQASGTALSPGDAAVVGTGLEDTAVACAVALWRGGGSFRLADACGLTPKATAVRYGHHTLAAWFDVLEDGGGALRSLLDEAVACAGGRDSALQTVAGVLAATGGLPRAGSRFTRVSLPALSSKGAAQASVAPPPAAAAGGGSDSHDQRPGTARPPPPAPSQRFRGMALLLDLHILPDRALGTISALWGGTWAPAADQATLEHVAAEVASRRAEAQSRRRSDSSGGGGKGMGDKQRPGSTVAHEQGVEGGAKVHPVDTEPLQAVTEAEACLGSPPPPNRTTVLLERDDDPGDPPAPPLQRDDSFEQD